MAFPTYGELLLNNNSGDPEPAVYRTEFESGPAKQYKYKSQVTVFREIAILFTKTEFGNFETWFRGAECDWGSQFFDWEDPRDGTTKQARIFNGKYNYSMVSGGQGAELKYIVKTTLEILES